MSTTKERWEEEINRLGASYASLTGENLKAPRDAVKRDLIAKVFGYCKDHVYHQKTEDYGLEIAVCVRSCLTSFDPARGTPFLHYLKAGLARAVRKAEAGEARHQREVDRAYRHNQDGEAVPIFDGLPAVSATPEEELLQKDERSRLLDTVERVFSGKQERVKPYLKKLLAVEYYDAIVYDGFHKPYAFYDMAVVKDAYSKRALPTQKEIAASFGKLEQDASRALRKFKDLVKEELEKTV